MEWLAAAGSYYQPYTKHNGLKERNSFHTQETAIFCLLLIVTFEDIEGFECKPINNLYVLDRKR